VGPTASAYQPQTAEHPLGACCLDTHRTHACTDCKVRQLSICAVLEQSELDELAALSHSTLFPAKTTLFTQDEPADAVFNITEGVVRLYRLLPDGRRQIVGFALPGDFLGLALLDRYGVSADTVTETRACRFDRKVFAAYLDSKPHFLRRLHEFTSHELSLAQEQMVLLGRRSAEERLAVFIMSLLKRFRRVGHTSVTLPLPMSRQDIADFLGLTIETVSRTFTKLAKNHTIVVVPDGVRLMDQERLEALAAG
jgi:CRP/FNR family transcriptional regulator